MKKITGKQKQNNKKKGKRMQQFWIHAARFACAAALHAAESLLLSGLLLTYESQSWNFIGKDHLCPHSIESAVFAVTKINKLLGDE